MSRIYNFIVLITTFLVSIFALFNKKLQLFVRGRKQSFQKISAFNSKDKVVWFHAASLGEFEQGRPIIEKLRETHPKYKILLTFFSPSGYEIQKNYPLADVVCYLPMDSKSNVRKFLNSVNPKLVVFIKYEFWPNYLRELQQRNIPTLLVSGIFRQNQIFFKPFGSFMRNSLKAFDQFFVQDTISKELLESINFKNSTVSGDSRFDRVYQILDQNNDLDFITEFKTNTYTIVAGSTWKEDEELLVHYINNSNSDQEKFIIAPHNINAKEIQILKKSISKKVILYSEREGKEMANFNVLILDTIGILTKVYSAADVAYVGGGLTKNGVHNVLEPAAFGVPILIGPEYKKYKEIVDLVELKGCKVIANQEEFSTIFTKLKSEKDFREKLGKINQGYIKKNIGATDSVLSYITKKLK